MQRQADLCGCRDSWGCYTEKPCLQKSNHKDRLYVAKTCFSIGTWTTTAEVNSYLLHLKGGQKRSPRIIVCFEEIKVKTVLLSCFLGDFSQAISRYFILGLCSSTTIHTEFPVCFTTNFLAFEKKNLCILAGFLIVSHFLPCVSFDLVLAASLPTPQRIALRTSCDYSSLFTHLSFSNSPSHRMLIVSDVFICEACAFTDKDFLKHPECYDLFGLAFLFWFFKSHLLAQTVLELTM